MEATEPDAKSLMTKCIAQSDTTTRTVVSGWIQKAIIEAKEFYDTRTSMLPGSSRPFCKRLTTVSGCKSIIKFGEPANTL